MAVFGFDATLAEKNSPLKDLPFPSRGKDDLGIREEARSIGTLDREFLSAFAAAAGKEFLTPFCPLSFQKAVGAGSFSFFRLIGDRHRTPSIAEKTKTATGFPYPQLMHRVSPQPGLFGKFAQLKRGI